MNIQNTVLVLIGLMVSAHIMADDEAYRQMLREHQTTISEVKQTQGQKSEDTTESKQKRLEDAQRKQQKETMEENGSSWSDQAGG